MYFRSQRDASKKDVNPALVRVHAWLQIQPNRVSADPKDIQVTEKEVNGEFEMEPVSNGFGEPMEITLCAL